MSNSSDPIDAFLAGLGSFLLPCVLPMVPGYLAMISGAGIEELKSPDSRLFRKVMLNSLAFILGFSIVFIAAGATATEIGYLLTRYKATLARIAGAVIVVFGLHMTGILRINALYADKRLHNLKGDNTIWGAFVTGFAFSFGWQACLGPVLGGILTLAAGEKTVLKGMALLAAYSLGLAVPFFLAGLGVERFLRFYSRFRSHMHAVEVGMGALMVVLGGLMMYYGNLTILSNYLSFLDRFALWRWLEHFENGY